MRQRLDTIGRRLALLLIRHTWQLEERIRIALLPLQGRSLTTLGLLPALGGVIGLGLHYALRYSTASNPLLKASILGELLVSSGTALTGVSAIAFSLSLFLQQSVSDLYSPQYFLRYSYDRWQKLAFASVVTIVLSQLSYGLYLRALGDAPVPFMGLVLVVAFSSTGLVFSLLLWQFLHVARKTRPADAIGFLRAVALEHYRWFHKRARRIAWLTRIASGGNERLHLARAYASIIPSATETLLGPVNAFSEITMRLLSRGDHLAAKQGLAAFTDALKGYLSYRRTSSMLIASPTHPMVLESDSQSFFNLASEKLNEIGGGFLRSGQSDNARGVVDVYAALASTASEIEFIGRSNENPIEYQLSYYLKVYVDGAILAADKEVPFRAIDVFAAVGRRAALRGDSTLVVTAAQALTEIGAYGASSQSWFIAEQCCSADIAILRGLVEGPGNLETNADEVLKQLFLLHRRVLLQSGVVGKSLSTVGAQRKAFEELVAFVTWMREKHGAAEASKQGELASAIEAFAERLYSRLRAIWEAMDLDASCVDIASELVFQIVVTLAAIGHKEQNRRRMHAIDLFIALPSWFGTASKEMKSPRGFSDAVDAACRMALVFMLRNDHSDRASVAVDVQFGMVRRAVEQNSGGSGYYEPRLMMRICYCGVVAMKQGREEVVAKAAGCIEEFEKAWNARQQGVTGAPSLVNEFVNWRERVEDGGGLSILEDAEEMAGSAVESVHLDRFMARVWGYALVGNRWSGYRHRAVGDRAESLRRLITLLRRRIEVRRGEPMA